MGSILAGSKGHPHPIDGQGESGLGFVLWVVSFAFTLGKMKNESLAALGKGTGRAILCRSAWPPLLPFCWFLESEDGRAATRQEQAQIRRMSLAGGKRQNANGHRQHCHGHSTIQSTGGAVHDVSRTMLSEENGSKIP